jgi:hypothetical protein
MSKLKRDSNLFLLLFIIASTLIVSSFAYVLTSGMLINKTENNTNISQEPTPVQNPTPEPDPSPDPTPTPDPVPDPTPDPTPDPAPDPITPPSYILTVNTSGNGIGSIVVNPPGGSYQSGTVVTLTPVPGAGSSFTSWNGSLTGSLTPTSIIMNSTQTIVATFTAYEYTLTIHNDENGTVTTNPDKLTYHYGESVQLTAEPDTGYDFLNWSGDLAGTTNPETIIIDGDEDVSASFTKTATKNMLTINVDGGGFVSKSPELASYTPGSTVQLVATANSGWAFLCWGDDLSGNINPVSIVLDRDKTITAVFKKLEYTIHASAGSKGSISPSGDTLVQHGSDWSFIITPNKGLSVMDVLIDGVSVGAVDAYTFKKVTANHTIAASFMVSTYTITASAGAGGSISPSGLVLVSHGSDQGFIVTADPGYRILNVVVDNVSQGSVRWYTFNNVQANHEITVSFTVDP